MNGAGMSQRLQSLSRADFDQAHGVSPNVRSSPSVAVGMRAANGAGAPPTTRSVRSRLRHAARIILRGAFYFAVAVALGIGWMQRAEQHVTPGEGIGYWLGIAGASAMLLLLVYPLRKRMPGLRFVGSVRLWFLVHMLLGIAGPALILFHCNFSLGSVNSNVALVSMLIVAGSGLIGRYLHGKIHNRLDGRRADVGELLAAIEASGAALGLNLGKDRRPLDELSRLAQSALEGHRGVGSGLAQLAVLSWRRRGARRHLLAALRALAPTPPRRVERRAHRRQLDNVKHLVDDYLVAVARATRFGIYDRLFALWHVLHMPLFIMLVLSAIVHVVGVHLY